MDETLGLLFLAVYIVGVIALAAGVTYAVIRIFPTERNPKKPDEPDEVSANDRGEESKAGSLFRRSKRRLG